MKSVTFVVLLVLCVYAMANDKPQYNLDDAPALFEKFIKDYNKVYKDDQDKQVHFEAFKKTLKSINESNASSNSATFDINSFADYTPDQTKNLYGFGPMKT